MIDFIRSSECTFMANFKNTSVAKLDARGFAGGAEHSCCGQMFCDVSDEGTLKDRIIIEQKTKGGIIGQFCSV